MRLHRFYVNKPLGEEIVVENVEGEKELLHQWTNVFRYTSGDEVFLFSPFTSGYDFLYRISNISKQAIRLSLVSSSPNILPPQNITLVMALVKKDAFETIVRQATELGVSRIIPVTASRSEKKNLNFERLSIIATEAAEQSGRGTIPTILEIHSFEEALKETENSSRIFGSLTGIDVSTYTIKNPSLKNLALFVGPEGGWTNEEEQRAVEAGCTMLKLTDTTLKADTAAVAIISVLSSS